MAYQSEIEKLEARFQEKPEQWFAALADAYRKSGNLDLALDLLQQWVEKRPNYASGHIVLARVYVDRKQDGPAQQAFERVLEMDAENIIALKSLSEIAERAGQTDDARRWVDRLLEIDPMNEEAREIKARLAEAVAATAVAPVAAAPAPEPMVEPEPVAEPEPEPVPEPEPSEPVAEEPQEFVIEREVEVEEGGAAAGSVPQSGLGDLELESDDALPTVPEGAETGDGLGLTSFDDELAWDAGERVSHAITREDIEQAEALHDDEMAAAAEFLPGVEGEEIPSVGSEGRDAPADEEEHGGDLEISETPMAAAPEPEPEPEPEAEPIAELAPAVAEEEEEPEAEPEEVPDEEAEAEEAEALEVRATGGDLPLIMPEDVGPEEPGQREPSPVVTETMAELYARQGLLDEARDIYRQLVKARPNEPQLARRLAALEAQMPGARAQRFSVALTGGRSARAYLQGLLGTTPMDDAFAAEPTQPATDDMSLATVFGDDAAAPTDESGAPGAPAAPQAGEDAEGFSFDQFFGGAPEEPAEPAPPEQAEEPPAQPPPSSKPNADDFKDWLKGLKG